MWFFVALIGAFFYPPLWIVVGIYVLAFLFSDDSTEGSDTNSTVLKDLENTSTMNSIGNQTNFGYHFSSYDDDYYGNDDDYHDERMVYHRDGYSGYSHDDIVRQKQEDGYFGSEYDD